MLKIQETDHFRKAFQRLTPATRKKVKRKIELLLANLFHPSLNMEKLEPKHRNLWSFRVDRNFRVILTIPDQENLLFLDIGPHDIYRKI